METAKSCMSLPLDHLSFQFLCIHGAGFYSHTLDSIST